MKPKYTSYHNAAHNHQGLEELLELGSPVEFQGDEGGLKSPCMYFSMCDILPSKHSIFSYILIWPIYKVAT